ncbi:MAG: dienelactone hydrolase family protein [Saprospiraceae bacterium]
MQAQDYSLFEKKTYTHESGDVLPYRIMYPKDYDQDKAYPLVLFLHGAGERGNDNEAQLVHGVRTFMTNYHREQFPCIVIAPQCPSESYWSSVTVDRDNLPMGFDFNYKNEVTIALEMALALTKKVIAEEAVNKKRVYITGLSMGGMGTLEANWRERKLFAAAVPICSGGDPKSYKRKHSKIPFWFFHGNDDQVVSHQFSRRMVERLKKLGADVQYREYSGVGHNSWDRAYAEEELLAWLFAQKK